jgi:monovalent cation:H+ antiporter-2, CPA2 family
MHNLDLIVTLTGSLAAALALGYATHRLGLSPLVGYLVSGILVGPYTPGFVANRALAEQLAEIGVILLMFGVGLHFHLKELLAVRRVAFPGALAQSLVATVSGAVVARAFGWDWTAGIVFGLALSVASTVVLLRVLTDYRDLHTPTGHIAVGWLVVEDLFTVLVLVLLPALFGGQYTGLGHVPLTLGIAALKITALVTFTILVGGRIIPWVLEHVAATRSRELFTLTVLVLALGIAVGSAMLFGVSMALGAFLAGMVVGRSDFSLRAASEALPMRDAFAVLFFVSVGMLLDPRHLLAAPGLVAATLGIILLGKPLAALGIVLLLGYPVKVALAVAVALAQIGEFSFILAALGKGLGLLTDAATNTLIAAAIVSITLNPLLYRLIEPVEVWVARQRRLWGERTAHAGTRLPPDVLPTRDSTSTLSLHHRAVVVGYGPVGQTVTRLLRENGIVPTVIELNRDAVRRLRDAGVAAVYGDASHRETLEGAGVDRAGSLILSAAGMRASAEVIRLARELNPAIRILARAVYVHELPALRQAGAEDVFAGEGEVALAVTETMLRALGATPEQIDRERARVHADLLGSPTDTARQDVPFGNQGQVEADT